MQRTTRRTKEPAHLPAIREAGGWLLKTGPMAILAGLGLDEWIYVPKDDRLLHLFISGNTEWEAKRFTREPFGDYSNVYQPMGKGTGLESLKTFLATRGQKETK